MSTSVTPLIRICYFDSPPLPLQPYYCYYDEVCCKEGCCSKKSYNLLTSWQFWYKCYIVLGIIGLFLMYRFLCWLCRKKEVGTPEPDDLSNIVNFMVSYNRNGPNVAKAGNSTTDPPPPSYNVAVHYPKPTNHDQVPSYEQATANA